MSIGPRAFLAVLVLAPFAGWPAATSAGVVLAGPVPPSVTYIGVESGQAGASVPIIGSALEGATEVRFGGRPAPTFTVRSPIEIVAEAPEGEGTVDVTVTTPAGMSRSGYGDLFTYLAPTPIGSSASGILSTRRGERPTVRAHPRRRHGTHRRLADASRRLHAPVAATRATTCSARALLRHPAQATVRSSSSPCAAPCEPSAGTEERESPRAIAGSLGGTRAGSLRGTRVCLKRV